MFIVYLLSLYGSHSIEGAYARRDPTEGSFANVSTFWNWGLVVFVISHHDLSGPYLIFCVCFNINIHINIQTSRLILREDFIFDIVIDISPPPSILLLASDIIDNSSLFVYVLKRL